MARHRKTPAHGATARPAAPVSARPRPYPAAATVAPRTKALHGVGVLRSPAGLTVQLLCIAAVAALVFGIQSTGGSRSLATNSGAGVLTIAELAPTADTFVSSVDPTRDRSSLPTLAASDMPSQQRVTFIQFSVPASYAGNIVKAELVLTRTTHHLSGLVSARQVGASAPSPQAMSASATNQIGSVLDTVPTSHATGQLALNVLRDVTPGSTVTYAVTSSLRNGSAQFWSSNSSHQGPQLRLSLLPGAGGGTGSSSSPAPSGSPTTGTTSSSPQPAPTTSSSTPSSPSTSSSSSSGGGSGGSSGVTTGVAGCTVSAILVPSCGHWFGVAPQAHTGTELSKALPTEENLANRTFDIVHAYHTNSGFFPTSQEITAAEGGYGGDQQRLLLENWKPSTHDTWAQVANGAVDSEIDAEANYIKKNFPYKFFLTIWHEPENDVNTNPNSGMTASDYAAMYRHVVTRLRADGVDNAVTVMNYMGYDHWAVQPWFNDLWPGDKYVDWVGIDPYASGATGGYQAHNLSTLVNRKQGSFPGFYTWLTTQHPGHPMMVCEFGATPSKANPQGQADFFDSVTSDIGNYPDIKSMVYFDQPGDAWYSPNSTSSDLSAYRQMGSKFDFGQRLHYINK